VANTFSYLGASDKTANHPQNLVKELSLLHTDSGSTALTIRDIYETLIVNIFLTKFNGRLMNSYNC
jgi:hypothetical protein